jgi:hypothetical protein
LFQISSRRWRFIGRQVEGNYPNWRQVVPDEKQFNTTVELTPAAIDAILDLIPKIPCHDAINLPIGLVVEKKKLVLRGRGANDSKWTNLDVEGVTVKGPAVTVFLNRQFLTKALKFGMSTIEVIDPLTPLRISNGGRQMIVMPIRADNPPQTVGKQTQPGAPGEQHQPAPDGANPIEKMWSKVKQHLRSAEARNLPDLFQAIAAAIESVTPQDARSWFATCGYSFI